MEPPMSAGINSRSARRDTRHTRHLITPRLTYRVHALPTDVFSTFPSSNPEYRLPCRSSAGYHVSAPYPGIAVALLINVIPFSNEDGGNGDCVGVIDGHVHGGATYTPGVL